MFIPSKKIVIFVLLADEKSLSNESCLRLDQEAATWQPYQFSIEMVLVFKPEPSAGAWSEQSGSPFVDRIGRLSK